MRRLTAAILLLYPRTVRHRHGQELAGLVQELIETDGASAPSVFGRLAFDGLAQRALSRAGAMLVMATLMLSAVGGLLLSENSVASARPSSTVHRIIRFTPASRRGHRDNHRGD